MAQLMPLPLTVSRFTKIQIGLPLWYRLTCSSPGKRAVKCVCVCVCVCVTGRALQRLPWPSQQVVIYETMIGRRPFPYVADPLPTK